MQILLVEDDQSLAGGLCKALRNEGFVTNHVAEGKAALHVVDVEPPDIVVLDLGLPDIDGLDVAIVFACALRSVTAVGVKAARMGVEGAGQEKGD